MNFWRSTDVRGGSYWMIGILALSLLILKLLVLYGNFSYDDPYITYRYAANLAAGKGFVYNPGEKVLSTTTPFFALLLGGVAKLKIVSLPRAAILLGCLALPFSGWILWRMSLLNNTPVIGWASFLLFSTFSLPATTISSETPIYICLGLLTLYLYLVEKLVLVAIFAAVLSFVRPDGILLPLVIGMHFAVKQRDNLKRLLSKEYLVPFLIFLLISVLGWGAIWIYFGSPFPVTLFAKQQQGVMQISQQFLGGFLRLLSGYAKQPYMIQEGAFAIVGLLYLLRRRSPLLLILFYTLVYFLAYSVLRVSRYYWYYAPLVPGFILLVGAGFQWLWDVGSKLSDAGKWLLGGFVVLAFMFCLISQFLTLYRSAQNPDPRIPLYRHVGIWLKQNTPSNARVGALEVGAIGFYSERYMVDFAGLIQPDVAAQMTPNSTYEDTARYAIRKYCPEYLVLHKGFFPSLEQELSEKCHKEKTFKGTQYKVKYDLIILNCNP